MKNKKVCCRVFPIILLILSALLVFAFRYFEGGMNEFKTLFSRDEIFNFLGIVLFVAIIPIGLFYFLAEKEKYQSRARQLALLGFLPSVIILIISVF